ncbi:MAG: hypothetical protein KDK96_05835 [Chlamydiia bacterium]|nr:hypothetical protein [Chlamydiia bacterium]
MNNDDWEIVIADVPDKEEPVAEIYYKDEFWAEINYEDHGSFFVCFCNKDNANYWEFPYEEAMQVLQEAKDHLAKFQRTPEEQAKYEARMKELENWKPTPEEQADYEAKMEAQRKKWYGNENTK